jgi:hypothetical protein
MKQSNFLFFCVCLIAFSSCSTPKEILKLKPQSNKTSWFYGQEYTGDSVYGVIVKAAFDEIQPPWYAFDVEVVNRSNMDYLVDPAQMFAVPLDGLGNPINGDTIYAVDPEQKLMEFDRKLAVNTADRKNALGLTLLAAGIDLATGIAVLSDDNPRNDNFRTDLLPAAIAANVDNKFIAQDLNELRNTWKETTLRKTTLQSGFSIHGKLLIPVLPKASYVQLNVPVDNGMIRISFMQLRFLP